MPSTTTDSWAKQLSDLATNFEKCCGAAALFYWSSQNSASTGLRLEAPAIMYEFVDNFNFGHDPEGVLFFHNAEDFNDDEQVTYKIVYNKSVTPVIVRVEFYGEDGDYKAGFITNETANMDTYLNKYIKDGAGKFSPYKGAIAFGRLHKNQAGTQTTLKLDPIGREAIFTVNDKTHPISTIGSFYYNAMSDFTAGTPNVVADYNKERVAFYQKLNGSDQKFVGVFYPNIALPDGDDDHYQPVDATWKDL